MRLLTWGSVNCGQTRCSVSCAADTATTAVPLFGIALRTQYREKQLVSTRLGHEHPQHVYYGSSMHGVAQTRSADEVVIKDALPEEETSRRGYIRIFYGTNLVFYAPGLKKVLTLRASHRAAKLADIMVAALVLLTAPAAGLCLGSQLSKVDDMCHVGRELSQVGVVVTIGACETSI